MARRETNARLREIRVFSNDGWPIYAAPNLIFHYVRDHDYSPPDEFVGALFSRFSPESKLYGERLKLLGLSFRTTPNWLGGTILRVPDPFPFDGIKPAYEWIDSEPVQKTAPNFTHGLVQRVLAERLGTWADGRGRVATEWRFRLTPPGQSTTYFVPDVAYLSYAAISRADHAAAAEPRIAPTVVIDIHSSMDRAANSRYKADRYLLCGTSLIITVDIDAKSISLEDAEEIRILGDDEEIVDAALPDFRFSVRELLRLIET